VRSAKVANTEDVQYERASSNAVEKKSCQAMNPRKRTKEKCVISGYRCGANTFFALIVCYAA